VIKKTKNNNKKSTHNKSSQTCIKKETNKINRIKIDIWNAKFCQKEKKKILNERTQAVALWKTEKTELVWAL